MKIILPLATVVLTLGLSSIAKADETFSDNFTRANVAATNDGSTFGDYIETSSSAANQGIETWQLNNDTVNDVGHAHNDELVYEGLTLGSTFTVSATFTLSSIASNSVQEGLIVDDFSLANVSDPGILVDISGTGSLNLAAPNSTGSTTSYVATYTAATTGITPTTTTPLTLSVTSTGTDTFTVTLSNGTITYTTPTITVPTADGFANGGYAGLFDEGEAGPFTNFSIDTVAAPEPDTYALLLLGVGVLWRFARIRTQATREA